MHNRLFVHEQMYGHCHTTLPVQRRRGPCHPAIRIITQWLDRAPTALGDRDATQCEGGWARLYPYQGPPSARPAVPIPLHFILCKLLNFCAFFAKISSL